MRVIYRVIEFLTEPLQHTLVFLNDIDKISTKDIPLLHECIRSSDHFVSTYVPNYLSPEFQTEAHVSMARRSTVIPNIYFYGLKPNLGELKYPNGNRGHEDIWIYQLLLNQLKENQRLGQHQLHAIADCIKKLLYPDVLNATESEDMQAFSHRLLNSSLEEIRERQLEILSKFSSAQGFSSIDIATLLEGLIVKGEAPPCFHTANHPSATILIKIAENILRMLEIIPCSERLQLLRENSRLINTTSTDFIHFKCPTPYLNALGLRQEQCSEYIMYKNRFSPVDASPVKIQTYISQLYERMLSSCDDVISYNTEKLVSYSQKGRVYSISI